MSLKYRFNSIRTTSRLQRLSRKDPSWQSWREIVIRLGVRTGTLLEVLLWLSSGWHTLACDGTETDQHHNAGLGIGRLGAPKLSALLTGTLRGRFEMCSTNASWRNG